MPRLAGGATLAVMGTGREISIVTMADHAAARFTIWVTCVPCWRQEKLDLAALAARMPAATLDDIRRRLRCRVCGARQVQITRIPYTPAKGGYTVPVSPAPALDDGTH